MSRDMIYTNRWAVGQWQFFEVDGREITESYEGRKLFGYAHHEVGARPEPGGVREWFNSLEHAMAAAIAEKYTGPRGAGGSGVGTAADWFMRMIGADQLVDAGPEGSRALHAAMVAEDVKGLAAHRIERKLEDQGYTLARQNPR